MQYNPEELNEILGIFKSESEEIIQELNDGFLLLEKNPDDKTPLKKLFQLSHSLKGASRMLGFNSIQDIAHKLEDILSFWKKEEVKINPDFFQEIYNLCDFLSVLIQKSVEKKDNYSDEKVLIFLDKLDNFLTYNHMVPVENPIPANNVYIAGKQMDISACILEMMFIAEKDNDDNIDDVVSVISDNISKLDEIFSTTEYVEIKECIKKLSEWIKSDNFNFDEFKSKLLELRNDVYDLYKSLNLSSLAKKTLPQAENKAKTEEKTYLPAEQEQEIAKKFDYVLSNLQKIKSEKSAVDDIIKNLYELIKLSSEKKLGFIISKTISILNLFQEKGLLIDNECYMVILQCIYLAKRISLNEKEENLNNLNFLIQRLSVVEDMFSISTEQKVTAPIQVKEQNSILSQNDFNVLKKNIKTFDLEEIKVLRVDTGKIDNLIAQTGELLINGIKTREHLVELSKINTKLVNWNSASKKVINYLKYLEKRGFFNSEPDESAQAFYKKAQTFFIDNAAMINELNNDFNHLYNLISEDDNKFHQTALEIETIAKGIRVLPLATIFHSFPRMIRDIAKEKNKKIDFVVAGSDTTVDKKIIEEIKMPLIHIIRNSVSHGIEAPEVRLQNNKEETGKIKLTAKQAENFVIITIEDDGYGINLEKVKSTAVKKGMLSQEEADGMTNDQLMKLLFVPGFSTDESVSDISGRGIGLDVVKTKITNLNGELSIDSELNKGCVVTIKLPISMSTIKTFILKVNEQKYAIPVNAIKYVTQISKDEIFRKNGKNCIIYDNHSIPVCSLSEVFGEFSKNISDDDMHTVIIIENADTQVAFITDKLLGDQEVFHKKLIPPILKIKNISGFTTLPTGEICLIINPFELIRNTLAVENISLLESKNPLLAEKSENAKNKRIIMLDDESDFFGVVKHDIEETFNQVNIFNNVNSVYDYVIKNETDVLICKVNSFDDDVLRLLKYLKTDENFNNIKLIIFSEIPEYETARYEKDISYSIYKRLTEYQKDSFIQEVINL